MNNLEMPLLEQSLLNGIRKYEKEIININQKILITVQEKDDLLNIEKPISLDEFESKEWDIIIEDKHLKLNLTLESLEENKNSALKVLKEMERCFKQLKSPTIFENTKKEINELERINNKRPNEQEQIQNKKAKIELN